MRAEKVPSSDSVKWFFIMILKAYAKESKRIISLIESASIEMESDGALLNIPLVL